MYICGNSTRHASLQCAPGRVILLRNNIALNKAREKLGNELEKGAVFFDKKFKDAIDKAMDDLRKTLLKYVDYLKKNGK